MEATANGTKVDHLFLLVGGNPLPNAVAGKLLVASDGAVTLLHSRNTMDIAERLRHWLTNTEGSCPNVELCQVEESNPTSIFSAVWARLENATPKLVALHYTGGTKAMAVHSYRALEQWAREQLNKGKTVEARFTYLDARTLQMVFDPQDTSSSERREYIGRALRLALKDLLALHGWTLEHVPRCTALLPSAAEALAKACSNDDGFKDWKQWIDKEFRPKCRRQDKEDWKNKSQLQECSLALPASMHLAEVVCSLRSELGLSGGNNDLGLVHSCFNCEPKKFCKWLYGNWLEHYVLDVLNKLAGALCLHECAQNIVPKEVEFDVDVIALRGYQLFAFACSTEEKKPLLKLKLFEAFVRARQLGGDEARVALVCCSDDPDRLQHEMRRDLDPEGRIRVFGRKVLPDLGMHVKQWIQSQSGEE